MTGFYPKKNKRFKVERHTQRWGIRDTLTGSLIRFVSTYQDGVNQCVSLNNAY